MIRTFLEVSTEVCTDTKVFTELHWSLQRVIRKITQRWWNLSFYWPILKLT